MNIKNIFSIIILLSLITPLLQAQSTCNVQTDDDQTICIGQYIEICASGANYYIWNNGQEGACITVGPNHTKTYSVTGFKQGCKSISEVTVNVNDSFNLNTDNDQTICMGQSVEICANGADSYYWNTGTQSDCITVSPHQTTTYQVIASKNGCEGTRQVIVYVEDSLYGAVRGCVEGKFGLTDATGEWFLEHENQAFTKFYVGSDQKMIIQQNGRVGIGIDEPMYKLDVCGTIRTVEVLVEDDWCDYVFDEDYPLSTLQEEKKYIEANGHLQGFESEKTMAGKISLLDVTKRQQVKIEEYALHLIQLNEKVMILEKQNLNLAEKYSKLETLLLKLQNQQN